MSQAPPDTRKEVRSLHVAMPGAADCLSSALQGAYRRERAVPQDMAKLLQALDRYA
jgi:hypothetical protein